MKVSRWSVYTITFPLRRLRGFEDKPAGETTTLQASSLSEVHSKLDVYGLRPHLEEVAVTRVDHVEIESEPATVPAEELGE